MRPRQWVKNLLVVVAPVAAGKAFDADFALRTAVTFLVFCLAASGVYLVNDVRDKEADRRHPDKRSRPIAAGAVPEGLAALAAGVLVAASLGISLALTWRLGVVVALYLAESLATPSGRSASRSSSSASSPRGSCCARSRAGWRRGSRCRRGSSS